MTLAKRKRKSKSVSIECVKSKLFRHCLNLSQQQMTETSNASKGSREGAISLENYCAGQQWYGTGVKPIHHPLAVGRTLLSLPRVTPRNGLHIIKASTDNGTTWAQYSFKCPLVIFKVLPVYARTGHLFYLIGGKRVISQERGNWVDPAVDSSDSGMDSQSDTSSDERSVTDAESDYIGAVEYNNVERTSEVWVSKDMFETCELVTDKAAFGPHEILNFTARDDGTLYVYLSRKCGAERGTWMSTDAGKSWRRSEDLGYFDCPSLVKHSLVCFRDKLYAISETSPEFAPSEINLVFSSNHGCNWAIEPTSFTPLTLFHDRFGDRLICFTASQFYQLLGDATAWTLMRSDWFEEVVSLGVDPRYQMRLNRPTVLHNGVMLLGTDPDTYGNFSIRSFPSKQRAVRDKLLLATYLRRRGIQGGLFKAMIAPFLFPF